ncbi:MAG: hypothetical protein BGN95_00795 [Sphingomonas sp. 66-10]|nr:MAG: hypothetical protein BGN95_00795 [Sphingomonas sp. 66-10]
MAVQLHCIVKHAQHADRRFVDDSIDDEMPGVTDASVDSPRSLTAHSQVPGANIATEFRP